jgi:glycosyltransferase involved in cell wall biosynthesis
MNPCYMRESLVGVLGSGLIGFEPFNRSCWSGSSYFFFSALRNRGCLHRAFGVEAPRWQRSLLMAKNFRRRRATWRRLFYMDPAYRRALTAQVGRQLQSDDFQHDFLQLGALYDVPKLVRGRSRCFSYHDGNLAESLRSPDSPPGLGARAIDRALAYEREVYRKVDVVFTMSEYLRHSFITDFGVPPDKVVTIGAGINLDSIPESFPEKRHDTEEILFIGVEFARKGGWDLLEAFRIVRQHRPKATLQVVGPRTLTIPARLAAGVVFHGYLSKSDPTANAKLDVLFRSASLFALPSRYEPFGIAPLEAMVHEVPALVTNRWALREMVTPGDTGEHVDCGDIEQISAKIEAMLADPGRLARMGRAGRKRVLDYYTWDQVVDRLVATLAPDRRARELAASGRPG